MRLDDLDDTEMAAMLGSMRDAAIDAARGRGIAVSDVILIPLEPATGTVFVSCGLEQNGLIRVLISILEQFVEGSVPVFHVGEGGEIVDILPAEGGSTR
jgi:hypothetical protein